MPKYSR